MTRKLLFACLLGIFSAFASPAQNSSPQPEGNSGITQQKSAESQQTPPEEGAPPEEDESVKPKIYAFNPLAAERDIKVGNFYMRQGKKGYRAAAGRFEDATKYNPKSAEAFFKLGEAEDKLNNKEKSTAAFQRVLEVAPDTKLAKEAKKKLGGS